MLIRSLHCTTTTSMHLLGLTEYSLLAIIEGLPIADIISLRQVECFFYRCPSLQLSLL